LLQYRLSQKDAERSSGKLITGVLLCIVAVCNAAESCDNDGHSVFLFSAGCKDDININNSSRNNNKNSSSNNNNRSLMMKIKSRPILDKFRT
jgi:hypothetical protein